MELIVDNLGTLRPIIDKVESQDVPENIDDPDYVPSDHTSNDEQVCTYVLFVFFSSKE